METNEISGRVIRFMQIICPICRNKTTWEENSWRPFCCERCKLMDLGKWVSEEYKIGDRETNAERQTAEKKEQQADK